MNWKVGERRRKDDSIGEDRRKREGEQQRRDSSTINICTYESYRTKRACNHNGKLFLCKYTLH